MPNKLTTEIFLQRAKALYGNRFDYAGVNYTNCRTAVTITCQKHGTFLQLPLQHLKSAGCEACLYRVFDQTSFANFAIEKFGGKYDYSKSRYVDNRTKVTIRCPQHGEFRQAPAVHLKGQGCPRCSGHKVDTDSFIEQAKKIHKSKYDYSKVKYLSCLKKVKVVCPLHGEFFQTPTSHLSGKGCSACVKRYVDQSSFVVAAKKKFGDKYDYSQVKYSNCKKNIRISCPVHGAFFQTPIGHLNSLGCPRCVWAVTDTNSFIKKAKTIHGDRYDYSRVDYQHSQGKLQIICREHGVFKQNVESHLKGHGCSKCTRRFMDTDWFVKQAKELHGNTYDYSQTQYISARKKVVIACRIHGPFPQSSRSHLRGNGCSLCQNKTESVVKTGLKKAFPNWKIENNVRIWRARTDSPHYQPWRTIRRSADFLLRDQANKSVVWIEYDGPHHFKPFDYGHKGTVSDKAIVKFASQKVVDKLDFEFAKKNGWMLHRINHKDNLLKRINEIKTEVYDARL